MTGKVKHYSAKQGYGFIGSEFGDIFFHYSDLQSRNLVKAGYQVSFNLLATERGLQAKQISVEDA